MREGELLILASDGFWDHFSTEDAVTCVWECVKITGENTVKSPKTGKGGRGLESNIGAFCSGELECRNPPHEECFGRESERAFLWCYERPAAVYVAQAEMTCREGDGNEALRNEFLWRRERSDFYSIF